jgi:polar amino acid transport system substrate-binding protein
MMKKIVLFFGTVLFLCAFLIETDAAEVRVGGYSFPPFVENADGKFEGITLDIIKAMNTLQDVYVFKFVPTASKRRYRDFERGAFDLIMFENIQWGWAGKPVEQSDVFHQGGEVYIARVEHGRDQGYFEDFTGKRIVGFVGYHYGFANFNADETFLKNQFNATMTMTHEGNIRSVANGRVDIAVVTISFLKKYLHHHPEIQGKILIFQKLDQRYNHTMLMRANTHPTISEINVLIQKMKENNVFTNILESYGIK